MKQKQKAIWVSLETHQKIKIAAAKKGLSMGELLTTYTEAKP